MNKINFLKQILPAGTAVVLHYKKDNPTIHGLFGTVERIDDNGLIHVDWKDGSKFPLDSNYDQFGIIESNGNYLKEDIMNKQQIEEIFRKGTTIILHDMVGEPQMKWGLRGIVDYVDDENQVHVNWENGSSLALNLEIDTFEVIKND